MSLDPAILRDHPEWYCKAAGLLSPADAERVQEAIADRFNTRWEATHRTRVLSAQDRPWRIHQVPALLRPAMTASMFTAYAPAWQARNQRIEVAPRLAPRGTPRSDRPRTA